jgi:hypothetical protein
MPRAGALQRARSLLAAAFRRRTRHDDDVFDDEDDSPPPPRMPLAPPAIDAADALAHARHAALATRLHVIVLLGRRRRAYPAPRRDE